MRAIAASLFSRTHRQGAAPDPAFFYWLAGRLVRWCAVAATALMAAGLAAGLVVAPPAVGQGDAARILFVHVPATWLSLGLYVAMALCAALTLGPHAGVPPVLMMALAPTGAMFTLLALWTGSLLGQAVWVRFWDARVTCELILLVLYASVLALRSLIANRTRADRACAVLALIGVLNLPIVYFSLSWWDTLHRAAAARLIGTTAGRPPGAMLLIASAFALYACAVVLARARCLMRERALERKPTSRKGAA